MVKCVFSFCISIFITSNSIGQTKIIKQLYFGEDTAHFVYCGGITQTAVFYFTTDTVFTKKKNREFWLAMTCPEFFGADSFQKNKRYTIEFHRDDSYLKKMLPPSIFTWHRKRGNFYVVDAVKPD